MTINEENKVTDTQNLINAAHEAYFALPLHVQAQVAADIIDKVQAKLKESDRFARASYSSDDLRRFARSMEAEDLKRQAAERQVDELASALRNEWHRNSTTEALDWDQANSRYRDRWRDVARLALKLEGKS